MVEVLSSDVTEYIIRTVNKALSLLVTLAEKYVLIVDTIRTVVTKRALSKINLAPNRVYQP